MAVRYRKYHPQCKEINCKGRAGKQCPADRPKNAQNGSYRKCGQWVIELFDENKKWQSMVFKDVRSRADAEKRLSILIGDRERGALNLSTRKALPILAEYCQKYLETAKHDKENTKHKKVALVNILSRYLGDYRLDKITPFVVEKFRIDRQEKDGVGNNTTNQDVTGLAIILNRAIRDGLIDKNPCTGIPKLKIAKVKDRLLSPEEIKLLFGLEGRDRIMTLLGLFTAARLNEILRLSRDDINFETRIVTLFQSKVNKFLDIPLSSFLVSELRSYISSCKGDRLFEEGEIRAKTVQRYSKHFSHLFKSIGINEFTFHTLRHCSSTFLQDSGASIVTASEILGHSKPTITAQTYTHAKLEGKRGAIENITNHVLDMANEKSDLNDAKTG